MNPNTDGIDHINVYSKAKTQLGQFLSNFAHSPIETEDGHFESIEGYWYWLGTNHPRKVELRKLYGWKAKEVGRELKSLDWQDSPDFKRKICSAIEIKIKGNPLMFKALKANKLPLVHYYVFGNKVIQPKEGLWVIEFIQSLTK